MPQRADFGGFYYDLASNLLAYHAVTATMPTIAQSTNTPNGLDAESWQNPPDLDNLFLQR
jgi:hypothetical protein